MSNGRKTDKYEEFYLLLVSFIDEKEANEVFSSCLQTVGSKYKKPICNADP